MTDFDFDGLQAEMASDQANDLLDKHLRRTADWLAMQRNSGENPQLWDLIKKLSAEPSKRSHVLASYGAALWRLLEENK